MGGKTTILDPRQLESIYVESLKFEQKANARLQMIQNELRKLNEPILLSGLSGEQGQTAKDTITLVGSGVESLQLTLENMSKFIEGKLAGAAQMAREEKNSIASRVKSKGIPNSYLKK